MQVTITRTIQIPDEIESINELEGRIHIFGLRLMREILCEVWQLCQRLRWACEVCGSDRITGEGYRDYGVMTVFGRVRLKRHRVKCHECTSLSQPADSMLKEVRGGHASIRFAELASLSGASWPYEQAATVLERMVGDISYDTGAASRFVGMPFLDSIEPADHHALGSLAILGYEDPNEFDRVLSHPVLADGITDEETPIVTLLYDVRSTNPSLVDTILEPTSTSVEERDIELPLAGPVRLTIVRIQPGASRSMDLLEDAVRFAEDHMGEPLPTNFVLLFYADAVMPDYAGHNSGFNMTVHPDFDSDDDSDEAQHAPFILAHEVAHYYWNTSSQLWLDEGAAEVMSIIYGETTTSQEVWGAADTYPCAFAADLTGVERLTDTQAEDCAYSLGTRFFLDLYRTLGEDEFRRGFRELYRMGMDILDSEDPEARSIDHVRDAFSFSEAARDEIIPKWYWSPP